MQALRTIHRFWLALLSLAIVAQIGAAGYGAFYAADKVDPGPLTTKQFDHGFSFHAGFGYFIFLGGIVFCLLGLLDSRGLQSADYHAVSKNRHHQRLEILGNAERTPIEECHGLRRAIKHLLAAGRNS